MVKVTISKKVGIELIVVEASSPLASEAGKEARVALDAATTLSYKSAKKSAK